MSNLFEELDVAIEAKNKVAVIEKLRDIKASIDRGDVDVVEHIASPANLTKLHNNLCEQMGVVRRLLQLRGRVPNARHRASLFVQAMINGVGYLKDE